MLDILVFLLCQMLVAMAAIVAWGLLGRPAAGLRSGLVRGVACFAFSFVAMGYAAFWLSNLRAVQSFGSVVDRVETRDSVVALTFDDGPAVGGTRDVLPILFAAGVRATFFMNGKGIDAHMAEARRIVAAGHEVGNHGWTHSILIAKPSWRLRNEVEFTDQRIRGAGYRGAIPFRAPFNMKFVALPLYLKRTHRQTVTWDVVPDASDEDRGSSERIAANALSQVRPGSIVLLHVMQDNRAATVKALPAIIAGLQRRGYRFVTVSDLLARRT